MSNLPQFFISKDNIINGEAIITGSDSRHLAMVRRVMKGDEILLRSDDGRGYVARIIDVTHESIRTSIISESVAGIALPDITLYMALLKGGNFEFVIQKAVEVGVSRIIPVVTERTVPDPERMNSRKIERWNKIASEACKQCLRSTQVYVEEPLSLREALTDSEEKLKIICHPGADNQIKEILNSSPDRVGVSLLIGPEGGFSEMEILKAADAGWSAANFGATHLRAETAAIIIPSLVIYEWSASHAQHNLAK